MDLVGYSSVLPREGETVFGNSFETFLGGKGANQAVAASRLGSKVSFIGKVGTDSFGQILKDIFASENNSLNFYYNFFILLKEYITQIFFYLSSKKKLFRSLKIFISNQLIK